MSDKHDKLVRQSHAIEPADDFARKIEERLRATPRASTQDSVSSAMQNRTRPWCSSECWLLQQLSFGPVVIEPQTKYTFVERLPVAFQGMRIISTGDVDGLFLDQIYVGANAQLMGGSMGVRLFENTNFSEGVRLELAQPGMDITLVVRNISDEKRTFAATIFSR